MATATASSVIYSLPTLLPLPSPTPPQLLPVENRLKYIIQNRRIRLAEFFQDYDPLRSGFITNSQFRRCLDQNLSLPLTDEEYEVLMLKYDPEKCGRINYVQFIEVLQKSFLPNKLDGKPHEQFTEHSSTPSSLISTTLSPSHKERTDQLLNKCAEYYKSRGIFVRNCYEDFDSHNMGYITLSQFHRSFPGPDQVSETEIFLLAQRYYDPLVKLYNYFRFSDDIKTIWSKAMKGVTFRTDPPKDEEPAVPTIDDIISRIRDTVYKYGIRTTEFFRDYDKLRSGLITVNQFKCGLSLCLAKRIVLRREEIDAVVDHFMESDKEHVRYKEFCHLMENAYNLSDFEKRPTDSVYRPPVGHLHKPINTLSKEEETHLTILLSRLKEQVTKRRLLLHPYFRDFDRKKGYTRGVTRSQFERLFQFLSLSLSPYEIDLIQFKFGDPHSGDINYCALIQAIDQEYIGQIVKEDEKEKEEETRKDLSKLSLATTSTLQDTTTMNITQLLNTIQSHVLTHRIRVTEYFQDFDPLRSGYISIARFRQGLSAVGFPDLSSLEFNTLVRHYSVNKETTGCVISWKQFVEDVDQVFQSHGVIPPTTSNDFVLSDQDKMLLQNVLCRLKGQIEKRRILVKPVFQDFDRHNNGHVTVSNYRQCLSYLELTLSQEESTVLEAMYTDKIGFNYMELLKEIQPQLLLIDNYESRINTIRTDRQKLEASLHTYDTTVDVRNVLYKIRTKVVRERIRVLEFLKDYDKLRCGRILTTVFQRALDLCGFGLTSSEIHALVKEYRSAKDDLYVDYVTFSDDVESVFTVKELEKMPTFEVEQFKPAEEVDLNKLSQDQEVIVQRSLHVIAETVRSHRISLFPPFQDYDKVNRGNVTVQQFHRVLKELSLSKLLNNYQLDLIIAKFSLQVGGRIDVNYNGFCLVIEEYAQTKWSQEN